MRPTSPGGYGSQSAARSPISRAPFLYPVHVIETINKIVRTSRQMLNEIGREPTPEELAENLDMPLEKVRKTLKIAKATALDRDPIGEEGDSQLGDLIEDQNAILPIDAAIQSNLRETTTRVLASRNAREERILYQLSETQTIRAWLSRRDRKRNNGLISIICLPANTSFVIARSN